ncbi:hypothetical protein [Aquamicrobium zhengzhouense]|nr:hypothetical protein [Aquamicrobium zhengzhouense]
MNIGSDQPFDWIAALALLSGAAVMVPSLAALGIALLEVVVAIF